MGAPPYAHGVKPYFGLYGIGQFDGQNSGHDFFGTVDVSLQRLQLSIPVSFLLL